MKYIYCVFMCASLSLMISCGGGEKKEDKKSIKIGNTDTPKKESGNSVNIGLTGNDLMQYDKKEIRVKAGQEVTLTLRHIGKSEKIVMGHNFVLLKQGVDIATFCADAGTAGVSKDWIPADGKDAIAYTKMLGGGESTTVTFTAPPAGTYSFVCSFPGHWATMNGTFIVE